MSATTEKSADGPREESVERIQSEVESIREETDVESPLTPIATQIYRQVYERNLYHGQDFGSMTGAISYLAAVALNEDPTPNEFAEAAGVTEKSVLETSRSFRKKITSVEFEPIDPKAHIDRFCERLSVSEETQSASHDVADSVIEAARHSGKRPTTFAATVIYAAGQITNEKVTQSELSQKCGVSEVSIRNHYSDFLEIHEQYTSEQEDDSEDSGSNSQNE